MEGWGGDVVVELKEVGICNARATVIVYTYLSPAKNRDRQQSSISERQ